MSLNHRIKSPLYLAMALGVCAYAAACTPSQSQPRTKSEQSHSHAGHKDDHASHGSAPKPKTVVPDQEKEIAQDQKLKGPSKTKGIAEVLLKASLDLGKEWDAMKGQQLRARELTLDPGAVVAVHQHEKRPGFAYILEGEVIEHRNDQKDPIVRKVGDVAIEFTGVAHWWENRSKQIVRALVVDVVPAKP